MRSWRLHQVPSLLLTGRRVRAAGAGAVTVAMIGTLGLAGWAAGYPVDRPHLLSGAAWLPSGRVGQVALLDGSSAEVAAQVQVAPPGERLDVVQQGTTAYAMSPSSGAVRRVDGATFQVSPLATPLPDAREGLHVLAASNVLYVLDTQRGMVATADPQTLARRDPAVPMAAKVAPQAAVLDDHSRLWVLDNDTGDLVWIADGRRHVRRNAAQPAGALLVPADGAPVIVDTKRRLATLVDRRTGDQRGEIALDLRLDDRVHVGGSSHAARVYVVTARGLLMVCDLRGSGCASGVSLGTTNGDFGNPVEAGGRVFIPDYATGRVHVVDLQQSRDIARPQVLDPRTRFQLLTHDGVVFFNDPDSERAGVIRLDGGVRPVAKYDPTAPDKGLTHQDPNPNPTPTPTPSDPVPSGGPSASSGCVAARIAVSQPTARVGEPVTLGVSGSGGQSAAAADWSFGDGSTGVGPHVVHRWDAPRTYQVSVRASFPGCPAAIASIAIQITGSSQTGTLTVSATGNGTITSQPSGISCPPRCSAVFHAGTSVVLTAQPIGTAQLDSWGGACAGSGRQQTCQVTVPAGTARASATFTDAGPQHRVLSAKVTLKGTQPPARACPLNVGFSATITVSGGPVTVTYIWMWSDGTTGPTGTADFTSAGLQVVETSHNFTTSGNHWAMLRVLSPNPLDSSKAPVTITCVTENKVVVTKVDPPSYTGSCQNKVLIQILIKVFSTGPGTVRYTTVWSDGYVYPEFTFTFIQAETLDANTFREFAAGSTSANLTFRARVVFPNGSTVFSVPVSFRLTCT